jgi:acyl carrier protein
MTNAHSVEDIRSKLIDSLSDLLKAERDRIDADVRFDELGLASAEVLMVLGDMEDFLQIELNTTLLYDFPTVNLLAAQLALAKADAA